VHGPLHAEPVGEIAVVISPELFLERHGHAPALGQRLEQGPGGLCVFVLDENGAAFHGLRVRTVRGAQAEPRSLEDGMQDLFAPGRSVALFHRCPLVAPQLLNLAESARLVEFQRALARTLEIEARRKLHGCSSWTRSGRLRYPW